MHRAHARYAGGVPAADEDEALVQKHAPLLDRVARRLAARTGGAVSPDDLWAAGAMGLLDAARRYDPARDVRFETFVEHRVRGAMLDEMRRMDHLPRRMRADAERLERARARLGQELGHEPSTEDLAGALDLTVEDVASLAALSQPHVATFDGLMASTPSAHNELRAALGAAVAKLPQRLQLVLSLHYVEGLTYREIAKILEVSEPRVCQLHSEAMGILRSGLAEEGPG
jgi:RNA polymerase sigma factor FliA